VAAGHMNPAGHERQESIVGAACKLLYVPAGQFMGDVNIIVLGQ